MSNSTHTYVYIKLLVLIFMFKLDSMVWNEDHYRLCWQMVSNLNGNEDSLASKWIYFPFGCRLLFYVLLYKNVIIWCTHMLGLKVKYLQRRMHWIYNMNIINRLCSSDLQKCLIYVAFHNE